MTKSLRKTALCHCEGINSRHCEESAVDSVADDETIPLLEIASPCGTPRNDTVALLIAMTLDSLIGQILSQNGQ